MAGQTLESFVKSLDQDSKLPQQDSNSHEHQFVLALAGVVTSEYMTSNAPLIASLVPEP